MDHLLESCISNDDANACNSCNPDSFLGTWNDVMTPLVIMSGTGQNTLPLAQLQFPDTVWN